MAAKLLSSNIFKPRFLHDLLPRLRLNQYMNTRNISGVQQSSENTDETTEKDDVIKLSDSCIKQLHKISATDNYLRVIVEGGGCSGFQYKFQLDDNISQDDKIFERGGAKIVVDDISLDFLKGSTIDYNEELIRSSFRIINNPKAEMGCSCGISFSIKIE